MKLSGYKIIYCKMRLSNSVTISKTIIKCKTILSYINIFTYGTNVAVYFS